MIHLSNLLQNFVNILVFIMIANRVYGWTLHWNEPARRVVIGAMFGVAGLLSMQMPIQAGVGITVDMKGVLAGLSGLLGGPLSAFIAVLLIGGYRIYVGGAGMLPGLICILLVAGIGALLRHQYMKQSLPLRRIWWAPVLFGWMIAVMQLALTALFPAEIRNTLLQQFTIPLLLVYPAACLILHYFLTIEWVKLMDAQLDRVTRLPSSDFLKKRWQQMIARRQPFALVILNVERLRNVNDLHGVQAANELLRECGNRLRQYVPAGATICRYNGRDFAVTLPHYDILQSLIWLVDTKKLLSAPYPVQDNLCLVSFSSGLAVYEGEDATVDELCLKADTALRYAMDNGPDQTVPYEDRLTEQLRYRTSLEKDLGFALERDQFQLHYQPQYELETGRLRGFEALIRWNHPDWGAISPAEFIPLAEETRLIIPIGEWVLKTACSMAMRMNLNDTGTTIAVNVSAVQLLEPDFPDRVHEILSSTGLRGERLELELTESTLVQSFEQASKQLLRIKQWGIRLALDDFGVGYSSLSYLRRMPFDLIKIDRSFIEDIGRSHDDRMTKSLIDWVKELRYGILAEGLESHDQLYWLKQWKCDFAQGYLFSRPIPEPDLQRQLRSSISIPPTGLSSGAPS